MEQCRENYNINIMDALLFTNLCSDTCFKPSDLCIVPTPYIISICNLWSTIMLICWLLAMCWIIPRIHWFAQEWSEVTLQIRRFTGIDCTSANLLSFKNNSKHTILILGGWQSPDKVSQDMWKCTEVKKDEWNVSKQNLVHDVSL